MSIFHHAVFPSIITEFQCNLYDYIRKDLIDLIYEYKENDNGVFLSNRGGWQSKDIFGDNESSFSFLRDYLQTQLNLATEIYSLDFEFLNAWINVNGKNNYNVKHVHPASLLSGVFWVKCSDNCGSLEFDNQKIFVEYPFFEKIDDNAARQLNYYSSFNFTPSEGTLVLFPSHMEHYVEPNESDDDRISIAFNCCADF